jgi:hypothetical protein
MCRLSAMVVRGCFYIFYGISACCLYSCNGYCSTLLENATRNLIVLRRDFAKNAADFSYLEVPKSISVRQDIQGIPDGWNSTYESRAHVLSAIIFYDGLPEDKASLVYSGESRSKNSLTLTWRFTPSTDNGVWIECKYAATTATLTKQLPIRISSCKITYDPSIRIDGLPEIKSISCR